jgi:hypothetical protein
MGILGRYRIPLGNIFMLLFLAIWVASQTRTNQYTFRDALPAGSKPGANHNLKPDLDMFGESYARVNVSISRDMFPNAVPPLLTDSEWKNVLLDHGLIQEEHAYFFPLNLTQVYSIKSSNEKIIDLRVVLTVHQRWDDLWLALISLRMHQKVSVVVMDSSPVPMKFNQSFPNVEYLRSPKLNHLASGWNHACQRYMTTEKALIICNEDVFFRKDWIERVNYLYKQEPELVWAGLTQSLQFAGFLLPLQTWRNVGPFDEGFRTYFEDEDYWVRIEECYGRQISRVVSTTIMTPPIIHRRSGWQWSKEVNNQMQQNMRESRAHFYSKWQSGLPYSSHDECKQHSCCFETRQHERVWRALFSEVEHKNDGCILRKCTPILDPDTVHKRSW